MFRYIKEGIEHLKIGDRNVATLNGQMRFNQSILYACQFHNRNIRHKYYIVLTRPNPAGLLEFKRPSRGAGADDDDLTICEMRRRVLGEGSRAVGRPDGVYDLRTREGGLDIVPGIRDGAAAVA